MYPNPNETNIPLRPISTHPEYLSPTVEEIKFLTLDSGPWYDMVDHILDDIYACTLWDNLQQNLFNARRLEGIARDSDDGWTSKTFRHSLVWRKGGKWQECQTPVFIKIY